MGANGCKYWTQVDSVNGGRPFCMAAAYDLRLSPQELAAAGCTPERRSECLRAMRMSDPSAGLAPVNLPAASVVPPPPRPVPGWMRPSFPGNSDF